MPWTAKSGNIYQLYQLDTNAISEILKYPEKEGRGLNKIFPSSSFAPCISIYSIIELRRKPELYNLFLEYFSAYSFFLLKPQSIIFSEELSNYGTEKEILPIFNSFTPVGANKSYDCKYFFNKIFSDNLILDQELKWRTDEEEIIKSWKTNIVNFKPKKVFPNNEDAERYIKDSTIETLSSMNLKWVKEMVNKGNLPDINYFPSIKIMLYSIYYRLYDPAWKDSPSEAIDIRIVSSVPYVDCYVTEKFQTNIHNKIKDNVKRMKNIQTFRINALR